MKNKKDSTLEKERSLTTIILYSKDSRTHHIITRQKGQTKRKNKIGLDIRKRMTQFGRSLTPNIFYGIIGLSHPSYSNKTKRKTKKTRQQ